LSTSKQQTLPVDFMNYSSKLSKIVDKSVYYIKICMRYIEIFGDLAHLLLSVCLQ
jgi:hypothetical protein